MTNKIPLVEGSKFYMTVTDGQSYLVVDSPDEVYKPKEGEIVRVYLSNGESYMIAFYKHGEDLVRTSGIGADGMLYLKGVYGEKGLCIYPDYKVLPTSQESKDRLLTALADAGYQYNEETHEVEKIMWKPRLKEKYWTFNAAGIFVDINDNAPHDMDRINNGLIFKTQQEAQEFFDKIKQMANERK